MAGEHGEIVGSLPHGRVLVAPGDQHAHLAARHGSRDVGDPIIGVLEAFHAGFGDAGRLLLVFRQFAQDLEVVHENVVVDALIAVHADKVHIVVAGPAVQKIISVFLLVQLRRDGVDERVHASLLHVIDEVLPEVDEFLIGGAGAAPPTPILGVLVERPDDDGNDLSVTPLEALGEGGQAVQPLVELHLRRAAVGKDLRRDRVVLVVPGIATGQGVVQVHARQDHHAPVIGLFHASEPEGVFVGRGFHSVVHEFGQVHAVHARIISAHFLGVGASVLTIPIPPVRQVVVVAEHPALLPKGPEIGIQRLGFRGGGRIGQGQCNLGVLLRRRVVRFLAAGEQRQKQQAQDQDLFHHFTIMFSAISYMGGRSSQKKVSLRAYISLKEFSDGCPGNTE